MNNPLPNPFRFGDPVEGDFYLDRPEFDRLVRQFLENKINVVLIGPRRFGKTSFLLNLLKNMQEDSYSYIFVDVFNITSHKDFLQQILRALKQRKKWSDTLRELLTAIPRLRPKITPHVNPLTAETSFDFTLDMSASESDVKEIIQDLFKGLNRLGKKLIFAIDEFQKINEINDDGWLEATLRTHMQQLPNTSFIFTGSRRSVINDMLNNPHRPLYKFCQSLEFPTFGNEFTKWIVKKFVKANIECSEEAIEHLRRKVQDTPNYVQMICFHLVALGKEKITIQEVDSTLNIVVRQNAYAYQTLLNTLTGAQQRTLRLCAKEEKQVFANDFLIQYEISSAPALASSIKALKDKEILDEGTSRGSVVFEDPLFAIWLRNTFDD